MNKRKIKPLPINFDRLTFAEDKRFIDIRNETVNAISSKMSNQTDDIVIEGLKRKGYEFENKAELIDFIKTRCRALKRADDKYTQYFADDEPFLITEYHIQTETKIKDNKVTGELTIKYKFV